MAGQDNSRYGAAATAAPVLTASARPRRRRVKVFAQAFFKRLVGVRGRRPCGLSRLRQTQEGRKGFLRKAFRRGLRFRSGRSWARATGTQDPLQPRDRRAPPYNPQLLKKLAKLFLVSLKPERGLSSQPPPANPGALKRRSRLPPRSVLNGPHRGPGPRHVPCGHAPAFQLQSSK